MTSHELSLDLASALAAPRRCADCASERLHPLVRDGAVVFLCDDCRRVWAWELGMLVPVDEASGGEGRT
jgi:hypothetical protein